MAFNTAGKSAIINVTPLIDILLVLLVTFMVITPVTSKGEETRIPRDAPRQPTNPDVVVLELRRSPADVVTIDIALNHQKLQWDALGDTLRQIFKTRGDRTLFLSSDRDIDFRYIAQATDVAHAAGVDNVAFMTPHRD